jgi:hypothetical protein
MVENCLQKMVGGGEKTKLQIITNQTSKRSSILHTGVSLEKGEGGLTAFSKCRYLPTLNAGLVATFDK